ncbi:hypothetical protein BOV88_13315 [Solemya velum gill symbiont]|uniref:Uncharacterized protein n=4 Tax=Solemya velum gill symbiont TaxID=2340 RepID=A0A1T2CNP0_SOVGS|nr:hypothetical protein [Solemya velum gill symbiont]OOY33813.1 hypothetical protein BOV88_13315 [Solemya velum gill symbiont]OOY36469.1 hypothetical protein BOV89_12445 [Solemya velum gill symbiont]OOY49108.1 hypothetical protein BOV94_12385 [Solemya velum gill symbiont]
MFAPNSFINSARAAQTDADFNAYCRSKFPNSSYQKLLQSWGTEHACVQGGTRQGIDFAEACRMTTGSRNYQVSGMRVLCEGSVENVESSQPKVIGEPDFNQYCRNNFPNSVYEKRVESYGVAHYCRRPGITGFTLQNIDLSRACRESLGTGNYKIEGSRVSCLEEDEAESVANQPARPMPPSSPVDRIPPMPGPGNGPIPFPQPGMGPGSMPPMPMPMPFSAPQPGAQPGAMPPESTYPETLACQRLGGKWRSGTVPMADQIKREAEQKATECDFPPMCPQIAFEQTFQGYMNIVTIWQCHLMFIEHPEGKEHDDIKTAIEEACEIEKRLDQMSENLMSLGASMSSPVHEQLMSWLEVKSVCEESDFDLYFVFADTAGSTIEGALPMGVPLAVELRYKRAPKNYEQSVKLELGENFSTSMELSVFPVEGNPKRFRSSPFTLIMPEI